MSDSNLRQRILDVATKLFSEQGFSATSVRQVVEACSCTKPSLYYYFDNKEELFSEVIRIHKEAVDFLVASLANKPGTTRESMHECLASFADWAADNPEAMRLLQRVETQHEDGAPAISLAAAREVHITIMRDLIERGRQRNEIRHDIDPFDCALIIAGSLSFQFEMSLAGQSWDRDRLHRTVDLIFDGIAA